MTRAPEDFELIDSRKLSDNNLLKSFAILYVVCGAFLLFAAILHFKGITWLSIYYLPSAVQGFLYMFTINRISTCVQLNSNHLGSMHEYVPLLDNNYRETEPITALGFTSYFNPQFEFLVRNTLNDAHKPPNRT